MLRRTKKLLLFLLLFVVCFSSIIGPASALSVSEEEVVLDCTAESLKENQEKALESFEKFITPFFMNPDEYTMYDKNGVDISNSFYEANYSLFIDKNFEALQKKAHSIGASLYHTNINSNSVGSVLASNTKYTYSEWAYLAANYGISSYEFQVYLNETYYADSSGKIVSPINKPTVSLVPGLYEYTFFVQDWSGWTMTTDNGKTLVFGGYFDIWIDTGIGNPSYMGSFEIEAKAYGDGNCELPECTQTKYA